MVVVASSDETDDCDGYKKVGENGNSVSFCNKNWVDVREFYKLMYISVKFS